MKYILIALGALILIGVGGFYYLEQNQSSQTPSLEEQIANLPDTEPEPVSEENQMIVREETEEPEREPVETIGTSVDGAAITAHHFGDGDTEIMFVGGTHGGYSFNTALVGFELIDYLTENPDVVPENVTVTVIPVLNPDGLETIVGTTGRFDGSDVTDDDSARVAGRFNGNGVDLNRNFDCEWEEEGTWQSRAVSGGTAPFSEPEAAAIRDYVAQNEPEAAVVYYSQAGGVYSATCNGGITDEVATLTNTYADASGYSAFEEFDYYEITGDMVNWMTKEGMAAISVLLSDHENTEWNKNKAGIDAVLALYAEGDATATEAETAN